MAEHLQLTGIPAPDPVEPPKLANMTASEVAMAGLINQIACSVHQSNHKWWVNLETGAPIHRNVGELLMLAVGELSEGLEGHRKNLPDRHLPHRPSLEVELADCVIRLLDMSYGLGLDLGGAMVEKLSYNATRLDHTREHRLSENGKRY